MPYVYAKFKNGKVFKKPLYETDFGFTLKYYLRQSCFDCQFKGDKHRADIMMGDLWGLHPKDSLYNKDGVSVMIVNSPKGYSLIDQIDRTKFELTEFDFDTVVKNNPMYAQSIQKPTFLSHLKRIYQIMDYVKQ